MIMVREIVVPESILEQIARDGVREAEKGRIVAGNLYGYYDNLQDTVYVEEIYPSPTRKAPNNIKGNLQNLLMELLYSYKHLHTGFVIAMKNKTSNEKGLTLSKTQYHSAITGLWLPNAPNYAKSFDKVSKVWGINHTFMLYSVQEDSFKGMDGYGNDVLVKLKK